MSSSVPGLVVFHQWEDICLELGRLMRQADWSKVLFLSGPTETARLASRLEQYVDAHAEVARRVVQQATEEAAQEIASGADRFLANAVIVIGTGGVVDVAKRAASLLGLPLLVLPSALSSDAFASPTASLSKAPSSRKESIKASTATKVLVDTSITLTAPRVLALSGVCDVLSNASALLDLELAESRFHLGEQPLATQWSRLACHAAAQLHPVELHGKRGHELLAQALWMSGVAMCHANSSAPCSGAEHSISHAIDLLRIGYGTHGVQVGAATLFCHHLRVHLGLPGLPYQVVHQLKQFRDEWLQPVTFGVSRQQFLRAAQLAVGLRPERYSVLNVAPSSAFPDAYQLAFGEA